MLVAKVRIIFELCALSFELFYFFTFHFLFFAFHFSLFTFFRTFDFVESSLT